MQFDRAVGTVAELTLDDVGPNSGLFPKLTAPRPNRLVRRTRVVTAIDRALRPGICWIAAPAGYGKTIAVADYLQKKSVAYLWYRIDEGDRDIASFFHHIAAALERSTATPHVPIFGPEYADQPQAFARRFLRAYFERLPPNRLLIFDDLHDADVPQFRAVLATLLRELPDNQRCVCLSRTLPPDDFREICKGRLTILDQSIVRFSDHEARSLVAARVGCAANSVDVSAAGGWAAGLVLLAEQAVARRFSADPRAPPEMSDVGSVVFSELAKQLFDTLTAEEQGFLLKVSLLPQIDRASASELTGLRTAGALLDQLHRRQLLVDHGTAARTVFQLHDLLRAFLQDRLTQRADPVVLKHLQQHATVLLNASGQPDAAIDLALVAGDWTLARRLIVSRAEALLTQGRRATLIDWCTKLPSSEHDDAVLCYWLGVANMADDAKAEFWLSRAWSMFYEQHDVDGLFLTAARAVLAKTDSWRTHEGLSVWTQRTTALLDHHDFTTLRGDHQLLVLSGMLRAIDFAEDYRTDAPVVAQLSAQLLDRLAVPQPKDNVDLRMIASQTLIEHAGSTGKPEVFGKAVDSVIDDLRRPEVSPWALGLWLVGFGSVSGRYFSYAKRGFPYASAEDALRAAIAIGEREGLRGVEFGALYHLQLLMKLRNNFTEFAALAERIACAADRRNTTQMSVVDDCQAALHTVQHRYADAYRDCDRFMCAIEAANEPPIERWPHFVTKFQVLLADRRPADAAQFMSKRLHLFDAGVRRRATACVLAAQAVDAKWRDAPDYIEHLDKFMQELRASSWIAALINLPELIAELCADALEHDIEPDFCHALIMQRALEPPQSAPACWPWALTICVLGNFRLERAGVPVNLGAKPPTRSLDILRVLAIAKDHTCALEEVHEWLWPDADGDQAKAACEQALHRLRKLLGRADLVLQREGKLHLASQLVGIDLDHWERSLKTALRSSSANHAASAAIERVFWSFPGPLFQFERRASWSLAAGERVRSKFIELTARIGQCHEWQGAVAKACTFYLRALDFYPTSERCYEALIRARIALGAFTGALEDYRRYERMLASTIQTRPSAAIRALIEPLLTPLRATPLPPKSPARKLA